MASKMVLRRQTGHICTECKESFRAKELLLEHYELVHPTKPNLKGSDSKGRLNSSSEGDDDNDNTTGPCENQYDESEKQGPSNEELLKDEYEELVKDIKVEATEEEVEGNDVVPLVDDGICAFEVIEEVVDGNEVLQEVIIDSGVKKILKRRRSTPNTDSSHNNQSVYSLCLAAEIASSMEQVQAAQSLLGMSQKEIEEGAEGGDEKMAALLNKKSSDNKNITDIKIDKSSVENNDTKKEKACNINLASKISFLQSLNKRITSGGKQNNESKLSSLITSPHNTTTPLSPLNNSSLKMMGGKLTGDTLKQEDLNITIGGNRYKIEQAMVEKNKNSFVIYEDQRQIHFPVSNNNNKTSNLNSNKFLLHNNKIVINNNNRGGGFSNRGRGGLHNNNMKIFNNNMKMVNNNNNTTTSVVGNSNMQDVQMIPVTQEIEVMTDCIKVEADVQQQQNNNYSFNNKSFNNNNKSFNNNNNNNNDSYVIQLVNSNNNTSLNNMQQNNNASIHNMQQHNNNNVVPNQPNYRSSVDASLSSLGLNVNPRNQPLNDVKDGKIYQCGLCNKTYSDCEFLKTHVEKHSGLEKQANKSGHLKEEKFTDDSDEENTTAASASPTRHQCRECGEKFSRLAFLKKHAKAEHGQLKAYVCGACNKSFPFACGLKLHALTHGAERRYSCQFCGRRFKHASNLQKHVKVVHVNTCKCRTVECVCGKRDPSSFKIDHACHICGRVCESSKHLEIHYRSHTGEKPEVCQICGKSFQHKSNLQKHQLKHTGIRPYQCPHCQRSFFVKHSYLGHLRLHTHDSPYTCETCGKSFISKNGLQVHSILHQDRMPFCCGQCGKEFAQLGNLNKHLSLHTGDKPYPCSYCDKKFVDTSALKRHMVIHTKERIYTCPDCGKSFQHFSTLRSHMTTHRFDDQQQQLQQQQQQQQHQQQQLEKRMCELCGKSFNTQAAFLTHVRQHRNEEELNNTPTHNNATNKMFYPGANKVNNNNNIVSVEKEFKRFKADDTSYNNNNIINSIPVTNNNINNTNKRPVVVNSNNNNPNNDNEEIEYIVYLS